ncbi:MAG: hypothetical protein ABSE28_10450 [Candidatus Sulfotelmatobacter sp.]
MGAIQKNATTVTQNIDVHQQRTIQCGAPRYIGITALEHVLHAVTEEKFVAEYFLVAVKDRRARHVAQLDALGIISDSWDADAEFDTMRPWGREGKTPARRNRRPR